MDLDELRNLDDDGGSGRISFDDISDDDDFEGMAIDEEGAAAQPSGPFLGMSAQERMFLSIMLFGNVLVLGIGLLLATGRLG